MTKLKPAHRAFLKLRPKVFKLPYQKKEALRGKGYSEAFLKEFPELRGKPFDPDVAEQYADKLTQKHDDERHELLANVGLPPDALDTVRIKTPDGTKIVPKIEAEQMHEQWQREADEKARQDRLNNESGADKFFRKVNTGLRAVADVGKFLVPKPLQFAYDMFRPSDEALGLGLLHATPEEKSEELAEPLEVWGKGLHVGPDKTKYRHAKLYKITSPNTMNVYIGSTYADRIEKRLQSHVSKYKRHKEGKKQHYITVFDVIKHGSPKIELIGEKAVKGRKQLEAWEAAEIRKARRTVNKNTPGGKDSRQGGGSLDPPVFQPLWTDDDGAEPEDMSGGAAKSSKFNPEQMALFYGKRGTAMNKVRDLRDGSWQCDLMFPTLVGKLVPVFCAIEVTTRLGFACRTTKTGPGVVESLDKLLTFAEPWRVRHMTFDLGSEFNNVDVKRWVAKHCAPEPGREAEPAKPYYFDSKAKSQKGLIERFNGTIRADLELYMSALHTSTWSDKTLSVICEEYNNKKHSTIGVSPRQAALDTPEAAKLRELIRLKAVADSMPYRKRLQEFHPGDSVRVWVGDDPKKSKLELEKEALGHKFGQRWTSEIYKVQYVGTLSKKQPSPEDAGKDDGETAVNTAQGTQKNPGWYITLEGVGSPQHPRRFSPNNLLKVEAPSAVAAVTSSQTAAKQNKKDAKIARFLRAEQLYEAAHEHEKKEGPELEPEALPEIAHKPSAHEAALRAAFAEEQEDKKEAGIKRKRQQRALKALR